MKGWILLVVAQNGHLMVERNENLDPDLHSLDPRVELSMLLRVGAKNLAFSVHACGLSCKLSNNL